MSSITHALETAFLRPRSKIFVITNDVLTIVTLVSVLGIVLETVPALASYDQVFKVIEYVAVVLFTLEYIGRVIVAKRPWQYVFSFFGVVDLLAILPTYLGLTNFTFLKTARVLRIMRFLRIIRLTKLSRSGRINDIEEHFSLYQINIVLYFLALFIAVLFLGSLLYIAEASAGTFASIPAGMWWALETILGGSVTGNIVQQTMWGEFISLTTRFIGLVLLGLLLTVVGATVQKLIFGTKRIE